MSRYELQLSTRFVAKFSFPSHSTEWLEMGALRRKLIRRRIWAVASGENGAYTLWCRLALEDVLALGLHRTMTEQLRRALVTEFPNVPEAVLGRRVFELETEFLDRQRMAASLPLALTVFPRMKPMRTEDLTLNTRFHGGIVFGNLPENAPLIQAYLAGLARLGIAAQVIEDDDDVVLSYHLSIAEAFALGYNRHAPDELRFALLDTFPELGAEEVLLEQRIRELEQLFWRRKKAS